MNQGGRWGDARRMLGRGLAAAHLQAPHTTAFIWTRAPLVLGPVRDQFEAIALAWLPGFLLIREEYGILREQWG